MYIYEPWVPWRVAAEQKATRGLRKAAAVAAAMVVAAARVRGDGRQRFLRDGGPRAVRRSKNIQINSAWLVPMMAANVVQHKTRPRRSHPCADGRTYSRMARTCARVHA